MHNNNIHIMAAGSTTDIMYIVGLSSLSTGSPVYPIVIGGLKVYNLGEVNTYSGTPLNGHAPLMSSTMTRISFPNGGRY